MPLPIVTLRSSYRRRWAVPFYAFVFVTVIARRAALFCEQRIVRTEVVL